MTAVVPLDQPVYGASFPVAVSRLWRKYADFSGRASRSEYWWVQLFWLLTALPLLAVLPLDVAVFGANPDGPGPIFVIVAVLWFLVLLAGAVPTIALFVRRMHDANLSGWLYLVHLIPYLGALVGIVLAILPPNPAGAHYDRGAVAGWDDPYRAVPPGSAPPPYTGAQPGTGAVPPPPPPPPPAG